MKCKLKVHCRYSLFVTLVYGGNTVQTWKLHTILCRWSCTLPYFFLFSTECNPRVFTANNGVKHTIYFIYRHYFSRSLVSNLTAANSTIISLRIYSRYTYFFIHIHTKIIIQSFTIAKQQHKYYRIINCFITHSRFYPQLYIKGFPK